MKNLKNFEEHGSILEGVEATELQNSRASEETPADEKKKTSKMRTRAAGDQTSIGRAEQALNEHRETLKAGHLFLQVHTWMGRLRFYLVFWHRKAKTCQSCDVFLACS